MNTKQYKDAYQVLKYLPYRCPNCGQSFRYGANRATSFNCLTTDEQAVIDLDSDNWPDLNKMIANMHVFFKELLEVHNNKNISFIICSECKNVTLQIIISEKWVTTWEEATALVDSQGFTEIRPVSEDTPFTLPPDKAHWFAWADLLMLQKSFTRARLQTNSIADEMAQGDALIKMLDPVLTELVEKAKGAQTYQEVNETLKRVFGQLWDKVDPEAFGFLKTAEILRSELIKYGHTNRVSDFSSVVILYSKALETELLSKIFIPFADSKYTKILPNLDDKEAKDSLLALNGFVARRNNLTLGKMGYCLYHLVCRFGDRPENGLAIFMKEQIGDINAFCKLLEFPERLILYTKEYRNDAAHSKSISSEKCDAAREYLLEEPIRLLVSLETLMVKKING